MKLTIEQLHRQPDGGVIVADFCASKEQDGFVATVYASTKFTPDTESPDFVPFDELTEETVIAWIQEKQWLIDNANDRLNDQLEKAKNPPVLTGVPWPTDIFGILSNDRPA